MLKDWLLYSRMHQAWPTEFWRAVKPLPLGNPHRLAWNGDLAAALGLPENLFDGDAVLRALSGSLEHYPHPPLATVYSGHQFGVYVPQLGDGRALLLGDIADVEGRYWECQLKGAGVTPFSRFADGRAVLRSSIREYLGSEALHGLGIPTTRALALTGSDDAVYRETAETAAVLTRIAPSFLRFGHFEYAYHRRAHHLLPTMADYVLRHHYPECAAAASPYLALFAATVRRTAELVAAWQSVGFVHGVLNSDNMSILGLTIDYGPFGFIDGFDRDHVPNHSDHEGRYAYQAQPAIGQWNLMCLASALRPLVAEADLVAALEDYVPQYQAAYLARMRAKLGLSTADEADADLVAELLAWMHQERADFTLCFRHLASVTQEGEDVPWPLQALWRQPEARHGHGLQRWLQRYRARLRAENSDDAARRRAMLAVNPLYVPRNYLLEQAIVQARDHCDYGEIERLRQCFADPFTERPQFADVAALPPAWAAEICLSCSS